VLTVGILPARGGRSTNPAQSLNQKRYAGRDRTSDTSCRHRSGRHNGKTYLAMPKAVQAQRQEVNRIIPGPGARVRLWKRLGSFRHLVREIRPVPAPLYDALHA